MDLVEKKIQMLEKQKTGANSGSEVLSQIGSEVKSRIFAAINSANESDSIDGRIQSLVQGLQGIIDFLNGYEEKFLKENFILDTKISVLEEIIDEYINAQTNEKEQE